MWSPPVCLEMFLVCDGVELPAPNVLPYAPPPPAPIRALPHRLVVQAGPRLFQSLLSGGLR